MPTIVLGRGHLSAYPTLQSLIHSISQQRRCYLIAKNFRGHSHLAGNLGYQTPIQLPRLRFNINQIFFGLPFHIAVKSLRHKTNWHVCVAAPLIRRSRQFHFLPVFNSSPAAQGQFNFRVCQFNTDIRLLPAHFRAHNLGNHAHRHKHRIAAHLRPRLQIKRRCVFLCPFRRHQHAVKRQINLCRRPGLARQGQQHQQHRQKIIKSLHHNQHLS